MPGFDGTGPRGMGPRTGGGFGYCPPVMEEDGGVLLGVPGYGRGMGRGVGRGQGRNRGFGRGMRWRACWNFPVAFYSPEPLREQEKPETPQRKVKIEAEIPKTETEILKERIARMEDMLSQMNERLSQLQPTDKT